MGRNLGHGRVSRVDGSYVQALEGRHYRLVAGSRVTDSNGRRPLDKLDA
jgi:hypothetical protein